MTRTITHLLHLESFLALDLYEMPKWMVKFWGGAPPPPQMLWGGGGGGASGAPPYATSLYAERQNAYYAQSIPRKLTM